MARREGAKSFSLPTRSRNNSRTQLRNVEYQSIDHDRTRATNREADERKRVNDRSPIQRQPIDNSPLQPMNYRPNDYTYDSRRHSQDDLDRLIRPRTPSKHDLLFEHLLLRVFEIDGTGARDRRSFDDVLDDKQHGERGERLSNNRPNRSTRSAHRVS